jgi:hypothetical protein
LNKSQGLEDQQEFTTRASASRHHTALPLSSLLAATSTPRRSFLLAIPPQEHPRSLVLSLPATPDFAAALLHSGRAAARRCRLHEAEGSLRAAGALLGLGRCAPQLHASVWMELGRVLRLAVSLGLPQSPTAAAAGTPGALAARIRSGETAAAALASAAGSGGLLDGSGLPMARLAEAVQHLRRAVGILVLDCGGPCDRIRSCLLELAACSIIARDPARAAGALQLASVCAAKRRSLQTLGAQALLAGSSPSAGVLPLWLCEQMLGQEACLARAAAGQQAAGATEPAASSAGADPGTVLRLAIAHFGWLQFGQAGLAGARDAQRCDAQLAAMAAPLRSAVPRLAAECAWAESPLPPADALEPAPGELLMF